jgi:hypothetical protein
MAIRSRRDVLLTLPDHYDLPTDLEFVGLSRGRGTGIIRIRFRRGHATTLDIPLSAKTLADLVQAISPLHGTLPDDMTQEIESLHQQGGHIPQE